jgi:signal transduction histidine kinase
MESAQGNDETILRIEQALHDLCQPLTVLQCKLELGLLSGKEEAIQAAVRDGLHECRRLNATVQAMRNLVRSELGRGAGGV